MKVGIIGTGWIAEKAAITLVPQQITGYEYQFLACRDALAAGLTEPQEMPHAETLYIMQLMDDLRRKWDVHYPMDEE